MSESLHASPASDLLAGKIAVVTGASRGIGAAIALQLAEAGATVIGTATSAAGAEAIANRLAAHSGTGMVLNVADAESVTAFYKQLTSEHGAADILVNNAGITRDGLLMRLGEGDWEAVLDANLSGVYRMCKGALRGMVKARAGRIVNVTSVVGVSGNPGQTNYAASKAGVIGFSKSLALEVASRGITVNCVAPGYIETDMTDDLNAEQRAAILNNVPLARMGQTEDIAAAVRFLAGPTSSYITGQTLHVNGGMHMV